MNGQVVGERFTVYVGVEPDATETCAGCGADHTRYRKNERLVGGDCTRCGAGWYPGLCYSGPEPVYAAGGDGDGQALAVDLIEAARARTSAETPS